MWESWKNRIKAQVSELKKSDDMKHVTVYTSTRTKLTDDQLSAAEYKLTCSRKDLHQIIQLTDRGKLSDGATDKQKLRTLLSLCTNKKVHLLPELLKCSPYIKDLLLKNQDELLDHLYKNILLPLRSDVEEHGGTNDALKVLDVLHQTGCLEVKHNKRLLLMVIRILIDTPDQEKLFFWMIDRFQVTVNINAQALHWYSTVGTLCSDTKSKHRLPRVERLLGIIYRNDKRRKIESLHKDGSTEVKVHMLSPCCINGLVHMSLFMGITHPQDDDVLLFHFNSFARNVEAQIDWWHVLLRDIMHTRSLSHLKAEDVQFHLDKAGCKLSLAQFLQLQEHHIEETCPFARSMPPDDAEHDDQLLFALLAVMIDSMLASRPPISHYMHQQMITLVTRDLNFKTFQLNRLAMIFLQHGARPHKYGYIHTTNQQIFCEQQTRRLDRAIQQDLVSHHAGLFAVDVDDLLTCSDTQFSLYATIDEHREKQPLSLLVLCRESLKSTIKVPYVAAINTLHLPQLMKNHLTFAKYQKLYMTCGCDDDITMVPYSRIGSAVPEYPQSSR